MRYEADKRRPGHREFLDPLKRGAGFLKGISSSLKKERIFGSLKKGSSKL